MDGNSQAVLPTDMLNDLLVDKTQVSLMSTLYHTIDLCDNIQYKEACMEKTSTF